MDWTNEKVLHLIAEYEAKPELWDPNDSNYKNKLKKLKAWEEIARVLNVNRHEVERKFRILLVQYRREKSRILKFKTNDPQKLEYSSWYAYKSFNFWDKRLNPRRSASGFDSDVPVISKYDFNGAEIEEIKIEPGSEEFEGYSSNETDALHFPESTVNEAATSSTKTTTDRALSPKISRRVTVAPTIKDIGDTLDATDLFVAYVASEIKTLRNRDVKKKLKRRILHALLEAGEEDDARGRQWSYDGEYDGVI